MKTVGALMEALRPYSADTPLMATWEGTFSDITMYVSRDGIVLLDVDTGFYEFYKARFMESELLDEWENL